LKEEKGEPAPFALSERSVLSLGYGAHLLWVSLERKGEARSDTSGREIGQSRKGGKGGNECEQEPREEWN